MMLQPYSLPHLLQRVLPNVLLLLATLTSSREASLML